MERFTGISDRLSNAIAPCINGVVSSLHADELIGFELTYELINGSETNAKKANKLMTELEGLLRSKRYPDDFLKKICSVLKKQRERSLNEIADSLTSPEVIPVEEPKSSTVYMYIFPEYLTERYTQMNGEFAGVLSDTVQEAFSKVDLEKIQLFLTGLSPCIQAEAASICKMSHLVTFLRKYCFLSNFGILQSLAKVFELVNSQNKLETFAKERDDFYKSILAEDFAKKAIEDHQTMDGQQEMTFKVSWQSNTTLCEFEAFLRDVFHRNKIFISLRTVHHSLLAFVCTTPNWLVDELILFVKENRNLLKLKGVVEVSVDKTIIGIDFSVEQPSVAEAAEPSQKTLPVTTGTVSGHLSTSSSKIKDCATCPVCRGIFQDPRVLSCHHSFCCTCLQKAVKKSHQDALTCPVCRKEEVLLDKGVSGLPVAHHLATMIEIAKLMNLRGDSSAVVSGIACSTEDCVHVPFAFCDSCQYLCEGCMTGHSKMIATRDHNVKLLEDIKSESSLNLTCPKHKDKFLKPLCKDCSKMVCPRCLRFCQDCNSLFCDDCLINHGYLEKEPNDRHTVHFLDDLIKEGAKQEKNLTENARELSSVDETTSVYIDDLKVSIGKMSNNWKAIITSKRDDSKRAKEELVAARQKAEDFMEGKTSNFSDENVFKTLAEYKEKERTPSTKAWLCFSEDCGEMEIVDRLKSDYISVYVNSADPPLLKVGDNLLHISLNSVIPVKFQHNLQPVVSIIQGKKPDNITLQVVRVGQLRWFASFCATQEDKKAIVFVSVDGVSAKGSPYVLEMSPFNDNGMPGVEDVKMPSSV